MPAPPPAHDVVVRLMDGYIQTQLLYVAARLGLADLLASGPRSTADLAAAAGTDASVLHRILRGLAINGIVEEREGQFALKPISPCRRRRRGVLASRLPPS
jgi:hypothetical protein